jgi:putative transposase
MSQSLSCIWMHIIFSTKKRRPYLHRMEIRGRLYHYIIATSKNLNIEIAALNGTEDHIHILANISKNISLASYIEKIKKSSSKWLKSLAKEAPELFHFYWQSGYGAFSVSQSNILAVKTYINNQMQHHRKMTFQEELIKFFQSYQIKYDEKYLWS